MNKIFSFLAVAVIAFFIASCGGGDNTAAGIEKSIYSQMEKGNYEKAIEILIESIDSERTPSAEEKAKVLTALAEEAKQSIEAQGGIKSFEITGEDISEDGLVAIVTSKIVYGGGKEEFNKSKYVNKDGKWKLSMGK